jgi:hypothetical protein
MSEVVHLAHCNLGEYAGTCKYGDDDCPALTRPTATAPVEAGEVWEAAFKAWHSAKAPMGGPVQLDHSIPAAAATAIISAAITAAEQRGAERGWKKGYCAGAYRADWRGPPTGEEVNNEWLEFAAREKANATTLETGAHDG